MTFRTLLVSIAAALCAAAPAFAGQAVALRPAIFDATGQVTLGEIFDDAGPARDVVIATRTGPSVVLDSSALQSFARRYGLDWDNPAGLRRVIVRAAPGSLGSPSNNVEVLTWAHSLMAGDIVRPQDLVWAKAVGAPIDAPRDVDAAVGMAARRALREGDAVGMHDLATPLVIKAGDAVSVTYQDGGISLTLQAKAMVNAAVGDSVTIQNTASKKLIEAVAIGPDQAVVGPEAARLKAERNPSQLALR
ncbi:MAG: flagellar basal body P-ring formation chaperone FlgA [Caulobacterales bacterium]